MLMKPELNENNIDDYIRERLQKAIDDSGISQRQLVKKAALGDVTLNRILKGHRSGMTNSTLFKIAKALNLDMSYFFGESELNSGTTENQTASDGKTDYVKIPLYESKAAATPGVLDVAKDEQKGELVIGCAELEHKGTLHAFEVRGKSMFPTLDDGDTVVIQTNGVITVTDINRHDIYLCEIDDGFGTHGLTLKRVKVDKKGLILFSINPEFEPLYVEMPKGKMLKDIIKGRVVRIVRDLK